MPPQGRFKSGHVLGHFSNFPPSHDHFKETTNLARVVRCCLNHLLKNRTPATAHPAPNQKLRTVKFEAKVISTVNLYPTGS